ncbi:MAG: ATP-dependent DNA ligase [Candidatus Woesearchaeota archaeon]
MKYIELARTYEALESTSKRLEKTHIISEVLKKTGEDDIEQISLLLQGRVFPAWDESTVGIASRNVLRAISTSTGISAEKVESEWSRAGDLGNVAENLIRNKRQQTLSTSELTAGKVFSNIRKLANLEGQGSVDRKIQLIAELLTSAKPIEARYVVRTVLEDLRVGVAAGTMRDAVVWAFFGDEIRINYDEENKKIEPEDRERYNEILDAVQEAFDVCNDFSKVARAIKEKGLKGLEGIKVEAGKPIKVMLFQKAADVGDAFEKVGKPAAIEFKYDGFRLQVHKQGDEIKLFTRRLEDVTRQFPDLVEAVRENVKGESFILDAEAVGFDPETGRYLPFQSISQRIKRKYDIESMARQFPVELNVFDIISHEGKNLMKEPFRKRRDILESIVKQKDKEIILARQIITDDEGEAGEFYKESLGKGEEGVMAKNLDGIYKPGSRVGYGVKIKPVMETLDVVIVGAEWGTGKRSGWLSSYSIACKDEETGELKEIGKVGTGVKELEGSGVTFDILTNMLKPLITEEKGREVRVKPRIVIEVNYEEIQKSPTYSSGYALRFPRVVRIREDRGPDDVSTTATVKELYEGQKA